MSKTKVEDLQSNSYEACMAVKIRELEQMRTSLAIMLKMLDDKSLAFQKNGEEIVYPTEFRWSPKKLPMGTPFLCVKIIILMFAYLKKMKVEAGPLLHKQLQYMTYTGDLDE